MRWIVLMMLFVFSTAFAAVEIIDNSPKILGSAISLQCGSSVTCTKGNKGVVLVEVGYDSLVLASATTLTAAQCGSTIYNAGAIEIELPEASGVLGCEFTFVTLNAANFDVDPDAADIVVIQTDAAGDKIRNATVGNSITLKAVSASQWVVVGILGTWADAN